jgi:phosphocarrier protein
MKTPRFERDFTLTHEFGMHARPAACLVKTASRFDADISISHNGNVADAKSILGILSLGIVCGEQARLVASGTDAEAAIQAIAKLFEASFDLDAEPAVGSAGVPSFVDASVNRDGVSPPPDGFAG